MSTFARRTVFCWSIAGVAGTFIEAIVRLSARAFHTIDGGLSGMQWSALVAATLLLAWLEGHRALQRQFVPRTIDRALALVASADWSKGVLAPLYAAGLAGADRGECLRAWRGVLAIGAAVGVVRVLPHPWRGVVDAAVATALTWGVVALLGGFLTALPALSSAEKPHSSAPTGLAEETLQKAS